MPIPFRRATEPGSIYEHVARHVPPEGPGLLEGGDDLPDEDLHAEGGIRFAPGALEGTFVRYGAFTEEDDDVDEASAEAAEAEAVASLHAALARLADHPANRSRSALRKLLREGMARSLVDPLRDRLASFPPRDLGRLYTELRAIVLESGHRQEVKFAMALLAGFGRAEDADLFRVLGRHEEFTLYAAAGLGDVLEDPVPDWKQLLLSVTGWGRTELSEVMMEQAPETCDFLLRHGLAIGNALSLATGCRLHDALAADDADDELLAGAGRILAELADPSDSPDELYEYEHGADAVERFLAHLEPRASTLEQFLQVDDIRGFLKGPELDEAADADEEPFDHERELLRCGFDPERRRRALEACSRILDRPDWRALAEAAVARPDFEHWPDFAAAKRLGVPLRDVIVARLEADPADAGMWWELAFGADRERIEEAIALAGRLVDLDAVATGPGLDRFAVGPEHRALDAILQELDRFPGLGWEVIRPALRSRVVRDRIFALRALSAWPRDELTPEIEDALRACLADPDSYIRAAADAVLRGEPIPEPDDKEDEGEEV